VVDVDQEGGCGDRTDAGLVSQGGAVLLEQGLDAAFEAADRGADASASTRSVLASRRARRCAAERWAGTSRASTPAATSATATCAPWLAEPSIPTALTK